VDQIDFCAPPEVTRANHIESPGPRMSFGPSSLPEAHAPEKTNSICSRSAGAFTRTKRMDRFKFRASPEVTRANHIESLGLPGCPAGIRPCRKTTHLEKRTQFAGRSAAALPARVSTRRAQQEGHTHQTDHGAHALEKTKPISTPKRRPVPALDIWTESIFVLLALPSRSRKNEPNSARNYRRSAK
jgi:hypothetical protein